MKNELEQYKAELEIELQQILEYWQQNTIDEKNGGFFGRINNANEIIQNAPKGSVLNARILWTFSAAFNLTNNEDYLKTAMRAFDYFKNHFIDKEFGGVYWTVDYKGNPLDTKKQIYALAFAIYGLSEYYICNKNEEAKDLAIELYHVILKYSLDKENGGYFEAFSRDWKEIDDQRLSKKDANEKKSMNTHLHLLEAFTNLYRIWIDENLEERITALIFICVSNIIDTKTGHLVLFHDEKWNKRSTVFSYGHDIESSWLLLEAAKITGNKSLIDTVKEQSEFLASNSTDGLDNDGALWYEYDTVSNELIKEKHWWPQAEAMVGFFNAWQITGNDIYLQRSVKSWQFVKENLKDKVQGEWFWGIKKDNKIMDEDKVGMWKGPYHSSRACIELITRIKIAEELF